MRSPSSLFALFQKGLFYCFSVGTESLIAAAMLPILTRVLPPAEYGVWILFVALFSFMRPVLGLMLQDAIKINYFDFSPETLKAHFRAALILPTVLLLIFLALSFVAGQLIDDYLKFPGESFWIVLGVAYFQGILMLILAVMQFRERHGLYLSVQILQTVVAIGLTLLLLRFSSHWQAAAYARMTALFVCDVVGLVWLRRTIGPLFFFGSKHSSIAQLGKVGLRLMPVGLAGVLVPLTDRLVVARSFGTTETGYFGIGALFGTSLIVLATGLIYAWQPVLFRAIQTKNVEDLRTCRAFSCCYFFLLPCAAVAMMFAAMLVAPYLMAYELAPVRPYIIALSIAVCCEGWYLHNYTLLMAHRQIRVILIGAILVMVTNAGLCVAFVSHFGALGAAWATALTYALATAATGIWMYRRL